MFIFFIFVIFYNFFLCESDNTYSIITPRSAHVGWLNVQWLYTENFEAKSTLMVTKSVGSMLRRSRKKVEGLCCGAAAKKIGVQELFLSENRWCGVAAKNWGSKSNLEVINSIPKSSNQIRSLSAYTSILAKLRAYKGFPHMLLSVNVVSVILCWVLYGCGWSIGAPSARVDTVAPPHASVAPRSPGRAGTPQSAAWRPATGYEHTVCGLRY